MADKVLSGPVESRSFPPVGGINIHTRKILDACRDKDCIDDLRVYPTLSSQAVIDSAFSVRPESAELIRADVHVDPVSFNRGYYTVDVTYFYRVSGQTFPGGCPVRGLAVFDKRVILYGSEGGVKTFSSEDTLFDRPGGSGPVAVVEAVDPIALNMRIGECEEEEPEPSLHPIPAEISARLGEELNLSRCGRQLYVTLGQFSMIRLEREIQLSLTHAENFLPGKECIGSGGGDDPCTLFSRVRFPMEEFYPPDTLPEEENYRDMV